ncbi:MAG TPA: hypothetical protein VFI32_07915 [Rhodanobacteraceae bacterium]|nr:hypothetical protein [Rhodanobacteraceae bacterium]
MLITAHAPVFSIRMPDKPVHDFSGEENCLRDWRFSRSVVSSERKMLARHRAGAGHCMPGYSMDRLVGMFDRNAE